MAFSSETDVFSLSLLAMSSSKCSRWCVGSFDRMYFFHCSISCSRRILFCPLRFLTYMSMASRVPRRGQCTPCQARKLLSEAGMLPTATILLATGLLERVWTGTVLVLSSVTESTIPLVSSVRIGLASRVLLVQANMCCR